MSDVTTGSAAQTLAGNPEPTAPAAAPATTATTTVTPPATPPTVPSPPIVPAAPGAAPAGDKPWYGDLGIEDKETLDWLSAKNFADPKAQLESHRHLEKLLGAGERIVLPKDATDQAGWDKVWNRLGRPEKTEGYGLDKIEGADPTFAKTMGEVFHKAGLSANQAKALSEAYGSFGADMTAKAQAEMASQSEADMNALRTTWGATFDEKVEAAKRVVRADGLSAEDLTLVESVWGTKKTMEYFAKRGGEVLEDGNAPKNTLTPSLTMTPDAAKAQKDSLLANKEWLGRFLSENPKVRQPAMAEMERLEKMIAGNKP